MIADIVVVLIIALSAWSGFKRGFVRSISKLCCIVVSFIAAKLLYGKVSVLISSSPVGEGVRNYINGKYETFAQENIPSFLQSAGITTVNSIAETVISLITVIAIIVITYFIAKLVAASLKVFSRLPVISFFNRIAGLITGGLMGVLVCYVVIAIVFMADIGVVQDFVEGSVIAYKMYTENLLINMIF